MITNNNHNLDQKIKNTNFSELSEPKRDKIKKRINRIFLVIGIIASSYGVVRAIPTLNQEYENFKDQLYYSLFSSYEHYFNNFYRDLQ